jgi:hypothetical protein
MCSSGELLQSERINSISYLKIKHALRRTIPGGVVLGGKKDLKMPDGGRAAGD